MKLTGLQTPAVQVGVAHKPAQRVTAPCQAHLSCSRIQGRSQASRCVARSSRQDSPPCDTRSRKQCLGHCSSKQERKSSVKTRAVTDEIREAVAQNGSENAVTNNTQTSTQQPKSEPEAASTDVSSTSTAEQSAPIEQADTAAQPSGSSQAPAGTATTSTRPVQPTTPEGRTQYRGFKHLRHNSFQNGPDSQARTDMASSRSQKGPPPIPVPPEEADWLLPGRTVVAKVVYSNPNGFKVEMLRDSRIGGWCPVKEAPYILREKEDDLKMAADSLSKLTSDIMAIGTIREFRILKTPAGLSYYGVGPMVSARVHDLDVLWSRTQQLFDACSRDKEIFTVQVLDVNQGGLICRCQSLQAFIPISQLNRERDSWLSTEDMEALKGTNVDVTVIEVDPSFKKIVLSMARAEQCKQLKAIHLGALMWGEIRRVEEFGAFVGLEGTRISGLLHISNISRARVESVADVFQLGERVRCLVMGMDDNFTRISLSTAELEENEGDIMFDKEKVYANAEAQAKLFMEYVQSSKDEGDDFDFDGDRQYDGGSYDSEFAGSNKHNQA